MAVLELADVTFRRDGSDILRGVDWRVEADQRWVVLGPNGCGKTTLARIATLWEHPSSGVVRVLGETLGHTDVRALRRRLAFVSSAMADMFRPELTAAEVVMCAKNAALEPWWHTYDDVDRSRAADLLAAQGIGTLATHRFGTLSSGERQRTLLARALMTEPGLLVLDEPNAGLDLGGREELVDRLDALAGDPLAPPMVLVTHHVEEIPPSFTHLLAMRAGTVQAAGPLADTLTSQLLCGLFDVEVDLVRTDAPAGPRYSAHRTTPN